MAGAGYKLFATGDVLTAAQVNTYLMQQTVMVFASSAARTSALSGVLAEGMVSYLQDTNTLEVYDGSAWIGATGDITALTAGTGVSITNPTGPVPTVAIDTAVTADLTTGQTLTNKTLTSPVLTTPSISNINAKGDILVGTADNTLGVITAGNNGENLVADSSASTGLRWQGNYSAGKNAIINGDFNIWQRGTSFTPANAAFSADRWSHVFDGSGATRTVSRQTFTAGNTIPGYEFPYFFRFAQSVAGTGGTYNLFQNRMEDVRTFAGQTVTISFWGKAAASTNLVKLNLEQEFGTGGSPSAGVSTDLSTGTITLTTSWQRFSYTVTVPSISGKTIGTTTSGFLGLRVWCPVNSTFTLDFVGFQVELGSTATAFQTATGTIQGELAACQRYYLRPQNTDAYANYAVGTARSTTVADLIQSLPVAMRVKPTAVEYFNLQVTFAGVSSAAVTNLIIDAASSNQFVTFQATVASGLTQFRPYFIGNNNNAAGYLGLSAEF
jgi:hypothetical protein